MFNCPLGSWAAFWLKSFCLQFLSKCLSVSRLLTLMGDGGQSLGSSVMQKRFRFLPQNCASMQSFLEGPETVHWSLWLCLILGHMSFAPVAHFVISSMQLTRIQMNLLLKLVSPSSMSSRCLEVPQRLGFEMINRRLPNHWILNDFDMVRGVKKIVLQNSFAVSFIPLWHFMSFFDEKTFDCQISSPRYWEREHRSKISFPCKVHCMKDNSSLSGNIFFSRCNSIVPADKTVKPPISALIHFLLSLNEKREKEIYCIYLLCALCLGCLHINILLMSDGPEVAAGLVFNQKTKWVCIAPQLIEFHWLPIAARIKFKSLMLTDRVAAGSAPSHLNDLVWAHASPHSPRSTHELHLATLSLQAWQSRVLNIPCCSVVERPPKLCQSRYDHLVLQQALEGPALPTAPALVMALIFLLSLSLLLTPSPLLCRWASSCSWIR